MPDPERSDEEPRSRLAVGYDWAARVTTVALEFGLPPLAGAYLDQWLGSSPLCVLAGAVLGFAVGMTQILRIAREATPGPKPGPRRGNGPPPD